MSQNTTGANNNASGRRALYLNTTGTSNTACSHNALYNNTTGSNNSAVGQNALFSNTTGLENTAIGQGALQNNTTGNQNSALGRGTGSTITTGSNLTCLGFDAEPTSGTATNEITLGNASVTALRCNVTSITSLSDVRDKKEIQPLAGATEFIKSLNPVSFVWDQRDGLRVDVPEHGFIAQELQSAQIDCGYTVPNLVSGTDEKLEAAYGQILPSLVSALQEALARIESLENQLAT